MVRKNHQCDDPFDFPALDVADIKRKLG